MMYYRSALTVFCISILTLSTVNGRQTYCEPGFKLSPDSQYELDLSKLDQQVDFVWVDITDTHPAKKTVENSINICNPLTGMDDKNQDKCNNGAYICRREIFNKDNTDMVMVVQNIAGDFGGNTLSPSFAQVGSTNDPTKIGTQYLLLLKGGSDLGHNQIAYITLECDHHDENRKPWKPMPVSYENDVLTISWKTIHACAYKIGEKPPNNGNTGNDGNTEPSTGSWTFFKILLVMAAIYLVGGALYNFKQYNARGLDLIPHRDFWLDLPYVIRDLISHCVTSVISRRRGGGGQGYVAV